MNVSKRKPFKNKDGSLSTVRSMSFSTEKGEVLVPTIKARRGQTYPISERQAIDDYKRTGKHLGIYKDSSYATEASISLHEKEARRVAKKKKGK